MTASSTVYFHKFFSYLKPVTKLQTKTTPQSITEWRGYLPPNQRRCDKDSFFSRRKKLNKQAKTKQNKKKPDSLAGIRQTSVHWIRKHKSQPSDSTTSLRSKIKVKKTQILDLTLSTSSPEESTALAERLK